MRGPCLLASVLALAALAACEKSPAPGRIQNVILVSIDTLRRDHVGVYGAERDVTPVLDALGAQGVVFDQAIAQAPWTLPSHASLLASEAPSALGLGPFANPGRLPESALTLAEVLRAHGFATAAVTGGYVSRGLGFDQGFDSFRETPDSPYLSTAVKYAQEWLDRRDPARPFFLFLHTFEVHQYDPPADQRRRWVRPYDGPMRAVENLPAFLHDRASQARASEFTKADWDYLRDLYDACVASVDFQIGRLLADLESRGLRGSTLVVLISDHGEEFGEHGGSGHGYTLYDECLRVPLILAHPSLPSRRIADQVRLLDLAPTIADLAGVPVPESWRGTSLVPLLGGASLALPAFAEHAHSPMKAVRDGGAKYVVEAQGPRRLLFDLTRDPGEHADLSGADPEREARLCRELRAFVEANAAHERLRSVPETEPDPSQEEMLHRLGYTADDEPAADDREWGEVIRCE